MRKMLLKMSKPASEARTERAQLLDPTTMKKNRKRHSAFVRRLRNLRPENIKAKQIKDLQSAYAKHASGHHMFMRYVFACSYGLCLDLLDDDLAFQRLRNDPFFRDMNQPPEDDDLPKWVVLFVFKAKAGGKRDRVGRYAATLKRYLREKVSASQVEQRLKEEGGIGKAYALSTTGRSSAKAQATPMMGIAKRSALLAGTAVNESVDDLDEGEDEGQSTSMFGKGRSRLEEDRPKAARKTTKDDLAVVVTALQRRKACRKPGPLIIYAMATPNPEKGPDWMDIVATRIKRRST